MTVRAAPVRSSGLPSRLAAPCEYPNIEYYLRCILTRPPHSVTVVGSTQGVVPEAAADFSSGGFSNYFTQPDYQSDAVGAYLSNLGDTNAGLFTTGGRGYPDVSAAGVNYQVNIGGEITPVSGTSASAPLFASIVALLNDRLIAAGKPTMGFLNPFLYSTGRVALDDVTLGNNPGCGTDGFPADAGWDPVRVSYHVCVSERVADRGPTIRVSGHWSRDARLQQALDCNRAVIAGSTGLLSHSGLLSVGIPDVFHHLFDASALSHSLVRATFVSCMVRYVTVVSERYKNDREWRATGRFTGAKILR